MTVAVDKEQLLWKNSSNQKSEQFTGQMTLWRFTWCLLLNSFYFFSHPDIEVIQAYGIFLFFLRPLKEQRKFSCCGGFSLPALPRHEVRIEWEEKEMSNTKLISRIWAVGLGFPIGILSSVGVSYLSSSGAKSPLFKQKFPPGILCAYQKSYGG